MEGQNHLHHKHTNSCICQENRIALMLEAEVSFSQVQLKELLLLWSLSKNISLHSAHSGLLLLLFTLLCSCFSKCQKLTRTFIVLSFYLHLNTQSNTTGSTSLGLNHILVYVFSNSSRKHRYQNDAMAQTQLL